MKSLILPLILLPTIVLAQQQQPMQQNQGMQGQQGLNNNQQQQQEDPRTRRARTAFSKRDANKDGTITLEEYLQTMSTRGQGTAPASNQLPQGQQNTNTNRR